MEMENMENMVKIEVEKKIRFIKMVSKEEMMDHYMDHMEEEILDHLDSLPIDIEYEEADEDHEGMV